MVAQLLVGDRPQQVGLDDQRRLGRGLPRLVVEHRGKGPHGGRGVALGELEPGQHHRLDRRPPPLAGAERGHRRLLVAGRGQQLGPGRPGRGRQQPGRPAAGRPLGVVQSVEGAPGLVRARPGGHPGAQDGRGQPHRPVAGEGRPGRAVEGGRGAGQVVAVVGGQGGGQVGAGQLGAGRPAGSPGLLGGQPGQLVGPAEASPERLQQGQVGGGGDRDDLTAGPDRVGPGLLQADRGLLQPAAPQLGGAEQGMGEGPLVVAGTAPLDGHRPRRRPAGPWPPVRRRPPRRPAAPGTARPGPWPPPGRRPGRRTAARRPRPAPARRRPPPARPWPAG